jgi:hypothetical protein
MGVGRDRGDLRVRHGDLGVVGGEIQVLLMLLGAVVPAREREDQGVIALDLAELARDVLVVGQLVVGKRAAGTMSWRMICSCPGFESRGLLSPTGPLATGSN